MKKIALILFALIVALTLFACKKGSAPDPANEEETDGFIANMTLTGRIIKTEAGVYFTPTEDGSLKTADVARLSFDDEYFGKVIELDPDTLTNGDLVKIEFYAIQELYPPILPLQSIEFIEDGALSDVNVDAIKALEDLGNKISE